MVSVRQNDRRRIILNRRFFIGDGGWEKSEGGYDRRLDYTGLQNLVRTMIKCRFILTSHSFPSSRFNTSS